MVNITDTIKKVCRRKLIVPLIISAVALCILFFCPFRSIFHPTKIDDISNITKSEEYVHVHAKKLYYTGYNLTKTFGRIYGYYYTLEDNKCIFTIIPIDDNPKEELQNYEFTAKVISKNKSFQKMIEAFSTDLNWNSKDLSDFSTNFVVSNADYHQAIYIFLLWMALFILLISLKELLTYIIEMIYPYCYPVCTFLGKKEQKRLIDLAQDELSSENYIQINSMYITENYFIDLEETYVSIIPLEDIIWCYRVGELTLNPRNTSPDFSLCFTIKTGAIIKDKHKTSDEALELLNAIRATGYDIIIGHSELKQKEARARLKGRY